MRGNCGAQNCRDHTGPQGNFLLRGFTLALSGIVAWLAAVHGSDAGAKSELDVPVVLTEIPRRVPKDVKPRERHPLFADPRFENARLVVVEPAGQVRVLSEGFAGASDPNVSFDGKRVLFAGLKERQGDWRIWEIGIDGSGLRPVSPEHLEARSPIYVSSLFTLDSPEPWFTTVFVGRERSCCSESSLYDVRLDGADLRRLTYSPNRHFDPVQTSDGRVIYAAERRPLEAGADLPRIGLYANHIEGTDVELYGGELGRRSQYMPCPTDRGLIVFVEPEAGRPDGSGQLACIQESRPHVSYRRLTEDKSWSYLYPSRWHDNVILVARRKVHGNGAWSIWSYDADQGKAEPVFSRPDYHVVQVALVKPKASPDGHSTVVDTNLNSGIFYGLNSYDSDPRMAPYLQSGMIKRVRFIEGVLKSDCQDSQALSPRRLVGEAPVEADGSFNVEVPADTPLLLQTLDEHGLALANCGWIWVKPKEKRGCIGCHEDPERVPENDYVLALHRPSNRLVLPPAQRRSVAFREEVAPILQKHCATTDCHGGRKTPLTLPLTSANPTEEDLRRAYSALLIPDKKSRQTHSLPAGKYVDAGRARTSRLAWQLFGTDVSRPWDQHQPASNAKNTKLKQMPPAERGDRLSDEELKTVVQWIDMGAQYKAADASAECRNTPTANGH